MASPRTGNADTAIVDRQRPLVTLDVWEHVYYLDYENERDCYIDMFLEHLVNGEFAALNFEAARQGAAKSGCGCRAIGHRRGDR